jgi:hypothetical protein
VHIQQGSKIETDSISLQDNKVLLELHDVIASKFGAYVGKKT